jgi:hypothetical protein
MGTTTSTLSPTPATLANAISFATTTAKADNSF